MFDRIQVLGTSVYVFSVIADILMEEEITEEIDVFSNLDREIEPFTPVKSIEFNRQPKGSSPSKKYPSIFGVTNSKNKIPVFNYFLENHNIQKSNYCNIIHSSSSIAPSAKLGNGNFIEQKVVISSQTILGFGLSIKRGVLIGHHCIISDFVDINPGVVISGRVEIGKGSLLGSGCVIIDGVTIGSNTIIGAGSVVTKDIPSNVVAYGNPCKLVRENK
ncbi:acetyltransferase [Aequorivita capsosiphonis]|uniref:acetyltransferase n=1 Tax=Aequorivita capsosiphonis TaxID=487317 RepID=UPI000402FD48|nr:acetyltransferase [Aequorivita capsosiphonis]